MVDSLGARPFGACCGSDPEATATAPGTVALAMARPRRFASRSALSDAGGVEDSGFAATAPGMDAFAVARPRLFADSSFVALESASSCLLVSACSSFATATDVS